MTWVDILRYAEKRVQKMIRMGTEEVELNLVVEWEVGFARPLKRKMVLFFISSVGSYRELLLYDEHRRASMLQKSYYVSLN